MQGPRNDMSTDIAGIPLPPNANCFCTTWKKGDRTLLGARVGQGSLSVGCHDCCIVPLQLPSRLRFVIELCEPIQVKQLDIANFELFSSTPKDFLVSISDRSGVLSLLSESGPGGFAILCVRPKPLLPARPIRYPTNKWIKLGTFHARDERTVQSFPLDEQLYAKYMKVRPESTRHPDGVHVLRRDILRDLAILHEGHTAIISDVLLRSKVMDLLRSSRFLLRLLRSSLFPHLSAEAADFALKITGLGVLQQNQSQSMT